MSSRSRPTDRPLCGNALNRMFLRGYANYRDDGTAAMASAIEMALVLFVTSREAETVLEDDLERVVPFNQDQWKHRS